MPKRTRYTAEEKHQIIQKVIKGRMGQNHARKHYKLSGERSNDYTL